jgi:PKHD-type hydroxylase
LAARGTGAPSLQPRRDKAMSPHTPSRSRALASNEHVAVLYARASRRPPLFSAEECKAAIAWAEAKPFVDAYETDPNGDGSGVRQQKQAVSEIGDTDAAIVWLKRRIRVIADDLNRQLWRFETTKSGVLVVLRYDPGDQITWHTDLGEAYPTRKLMLMVQLSSPDAYQGGDLELGHPYSTKASREQGALIAFPAWVLHRVTPVTAGRRYAATFVVNGPSFR